MPNKMNRAAYAQMFGPTVGDKVRLADTNIVGAPQSGEQIFVSKNLCFRGKPLNQVTVSALRRKSRPTRPDR